jgi:hypothetical protein
MLRLKFHLRTWWWLYALMLFIMVVIPAVSAKYERLEALEVVKKNPKTNYELVAEVDDCKVYKLKTNLDVNFIVCETSHGAVTSYRR